MASRRAPISFVVGRLRGQESPSIQSVLFARAEWSRARATAWLKRHRFHVSPLEALQRYFRARQVEPGRFQRGTLRTIHTAGHPQPLKNPRTRPARLVVPERALRQAVTLYRKFREAEPEKIAVRSFHMPRMLMQVGPAHSIEYFTTHRGRPKLYRHTFAHGAAPVLCATGDGRHVYLLGGHYDFTRDGIVDR
jgi:hypothetical protein